MEDFADANAVLPIPATYDLGLSQGTDMVGSMRGFGVDPSAFALDELISPFDLDESGQFEHAMREETLSASDDGSSEFGEQPGLAADDVFSVDGMGAEPEKPLSSSLSDNSLRMMKPRQSSEKRFSPFPSGSSSLSASPARPRFPKASNPSIAAPVVHGMGGLAGFPAGVGTSVSVGIMNGLPNAASVHTVKLSSSLPAHGLAMPSSENKRCVCCGCTK